MEEEVAGTEVEARYLIQQYKSGEWRIHRSLPKPTSEAAARQELKAAYDKTRARYRLVHYRKIEREVITPVQEIGG